MYTCMPSACRPHIHPHIHHQVPALLARDVIKAGGRVLLDSPVHLITQQVWNKVWGFVWNKVYVRLVPMASHIEVGNRQNAATSVINESLPKPQESIESAPLGSTKSGGDDGIKGRQPAASLVTVYTEDEVITARAVIVAMPHHLAGRIRYDPPMPVSVALMEAVHAFGINASICRNLLLL